jgi:acetoin utilization protein AcuB
MPVGFLVRDFMASPATTLPYGASLFEAAVLLRRTGFRHLPVVDGERLVGIITDRDISRLAPSVLEAITQEEYNAILQNTVLEMAMTRDPIAVPPDTPVVDAVAILHHKKLGCLPVVEGERLVGIITVTDMLGLLHQLLGGKVVSEFELEGA